MKLIIIAFFALTTLVLSDLVGKVIPAEEAFTEMKKSILECISKNENASAELKNYVNDNINNGYKDTLLLAKFIENETDRLVIRQCRRQSFLFTYKKRLKPLPLVPKEQIKPKINN